MHVYYLHKIELNLCTKQTFIAAFHCEINNRNIMYVIYIYEYNIVILIRWLLSDLTSAVLVCVFFCLVCVVMLLIHD